MITETEMDKEADIENAKMYLLNLKHSKGKLTGCTSYIQRKMQIGYNHAARIMEVLEQRRFITAPDENGERRGVDL